MTQFTPLECKLQRFLAYSESHASCWTEEKRTLDLLTSGQKLGVQREEQHKKSFSFPLELTATSEIELSGQTYSVIRCASHGTDVGYKKGDEQNIFGQMKEIIILHNL